LVNFTTTEIFDKMPVSPSLMVEFHRIERFALSIDLNVFPTRIPSLFAFSGVETTFQENYWF